MLETGRLKIRIIGADSPRAGGAQKILQLAYSVRLNQTAEDCGAIFSQIQLPWLARDIPEPFRCTASLFTQPIRLSALTWSQPFFSSNTFSSAPS